MKLPPMTMSAARIIAGGGVFALTLLVLVMIAWRPELAKDDLFKMLAQAIVIQGLVGLVMAFLFTGNQHPSEPAPPSAKDAANEVADAADRRASQISGDER